MLRLRMEVVAALKARNSKAQGKAAKRPQPWVRMSERSALKGRHRFFLAIKTCAALSGLVLLSNISWGLRPRLCCGALSALGQAQL
jgi:hypothetical protein